MSAKRSRPSDPPPPKSGDGEAGLSRRELLASALLLPVLGSFGQRGAPRLPDIRKAPYRVVGGPGADALVVTREWIGQSPVCVSRLRNPTDRPVAVTEVVLFDIDLRMVPERALLYGEGFQMLSQTAGTVGVPVDAGAYTDAKHYRCRCRPASDLYGLMTIDSPLGGADAHVLDSATPSGPGLCRAAAASAGCSASAAPRRSRSSIPRDWTRPGKPGSSRGAPH